MSVELQTDYCEHGITLKHPAEGYFLCPYGCTEGVPMCAECGHEAHSPGHCVMLGCGACEGGSGS